MIKLTVLRITFATALVASTAFGQTSKSSTTAAGDWKRYLVSAPEVVYPQVLLRTNSAGSTIFRLSINPKNGEVTEVKVIQTTCSKLLNAIYIMNFFQWRFQPGTITTIQIQRGIQISNVATQYH